MVGMMMCVIIAVDNVIPEAKQTSYVVETITTTMTTVTEHRIIQTAEDSDQPPPKPPKAVTLQPPALPEGRSSIYASSQSVENMKNDLNATVIPKFNVNGTAQAITGILKGGKLRKTDSIQVIIRVYSFKRITKKKLQPEKNKNCFSWILNE